MSFYLGPELAQLRQAALLEEAANESLARLAREGRPERSGTRLPIGRLIAVTAIALVVVAIVAGFDVGGLVQVAGKRGGFG